MPCNCFISVTLDGINYSECEEPFKIYSNDINLTQVFPKCGSVKGGTTVTLNTNIDAETAMFLQDLKIGLRPKRGRNSQLSGANEQSNAHLHRNSQNSVGEANQQSDRNGAQYHDQEQFGSGASQGAQMSGSKMGPGNEELDVWVTAEGYF